MTKLYLIFITVLLTTYLFGQDKGDNIIIVTLEDSTDLYTKTKIALVKNDFVVKDDGNKDTLSTYSRELKTIPGYTVVWAILNGNQIELSGVYSLKKRTYLGYIKPGKLSNRIIYYRGSKTWQLLEKVATTIGGKLSFENEKTVD